MFVCSFCDAQSPKWAGRCSQCSKWGTLLESGETAPTKKVKAAAAASVQTFADIPSTASAKQPTNIAEFDRVLGGGLVPGQVVLLAGEPGIGKSTLLTAVAGSIGKLVLYVAGEESPTQLKLRFERLKTPTDQVRVLTETIVEPVVAAIEAHRPSLVIVDSIQTMTTRDHDAAAGVVTHLRAATAQLAAVAKQHDIAIILVGQVTKDGAIAGPKLLEHMVDTVLNFSGDPQHAYRIVRASKHRFGSVDEIGLFEMTPEGLVSVSSAADRFLNPNQAVPGSVITCTIQGARAFLVEIQALVNTSNYGTPVRRGSGFSTNRLQMLLAILEKHARVSFAGQDVYVNVVGGMSVDEPAMDLAVAAALVSSKLDHALPDKTVIFGEIGLGGEVRPVPFAERRIKEAARLGIKKAVHPKTLSHLRTLKDIIAP